MRSVRIVYDGACPFCSRYVRLVRLREQFAVELVDARQEPERAGAYGLDLNEGMIVDVDGVPHHGDAAVWILSTISSRVGLWNRMLAALLSSPGRAKFFYPILRLGRGMTLRALGRKKL